MGRTVHRVAAIAIAMCGASLTGAQTSPDTVVVPADGSVPAKVYPHGVIVKFEESSGSAVLKGLKAGPKGGIAFSSAQKLTKDITMTKVEVHVVSAPNAIGLGALSGGFAGTLTLTDCTISLSCAANAAGVAIDAGKALLSHSSVKFRKTTVSLVANGDSTTNALTISSDSGASSVVVDFLNSKIIVSGTGGIDAQHVTGLSLSLTEGDTAWHVSLQSTTVEVVHRTPAASQAELFIASGIEVSGHSGLLPKIVDSIFLVDSSNFTIDGGAAVGVMIQADIESGSSIKMSKTLFSTKGHSSFSLYLGGLRDSTIVLSGNTIDVAGRPSINSFLGVVTLNAASDSTLTWTGGSVKATVPEHFAMMQCVSDDISGGSIYISDFPVDVAAEKGDVALLKASTFSGHATVKMTKLMTNLTTETGNIAALVINSLLNHSAFTLSDSKLDLQSASGNVAALQVTNLADWAKVAVTTSTFNAAGAAAQSSSDTAAIFEIHGVETGGSAMVDDVTSSAKSAGQRLIFFAGRKASICFSEAPRRKAARFDAHAVKFSAVDPVTAVTVAPVTIVPPNCGYQPLVADVANSHFTFGISTAAALHHALTGVATIRGPIDTDLSLRVYGGSAMYVASNAPALSVLHNLGAIRTTSPVTKSGSVVIDMEDFSLVVKWPSCQSPPTDQVVHGMTPQNMTSDAVGAATLCMKTVNVGCDGSLTTASAMQQTTFWKTSLPSNYTPKTESGGCAFGGHDPHNQPHTVSPQPVTTAPSALPSSSSASPEVHHKTAATGAIVGALTGVIVVVGGAIGAAVFWRLRSARRSALEGRLGDGLTVVEHAPSSSYSEVSKA